MSDTRSDSSKMRVVAGFVAGAACTVGLLALFGLGVRRGSSVDSGSLLHRSFLLVPLFLAAGFVLFVRRWRRSHLPLAWSLLGGCALVYAFMVGSFLVDPLGLGSTTEPTDAEGALARAVPPLEPAIPLNSYGADRLAAMHQGGNSYVEASQPSSGPNVVSVNAIDENTWGAAAQSNETGTCYLILIVRDPNDPTSSRALRGELSKGSLCLGSAANPKEISTDN
jgi:hypothetical protein